MARRSLVPLPDLVFSIAASPNIPSDDGGNRVRKRNRVFAGHPKFTQVSERNVLQAGDNDFPTFEGCHRLVTRKKAVPS